MILVVFVGLALFGVVYFITLYFQNVKGWSPQKSGLAALPLTSMVMLIGPFAGKLQERFTPRQLMTTGMLMLTGGLIGLSQIQVDTSYNQIWPFYVLMGAGLALTMPTTSATAMAAVDPRKAGVASGRGQLGAAGGRGRRPCGARRRRRHAGHPPVGAGPVVAPAGAAGARPGGRGAGDRRAGPGDRPGRRPGGARTARSSPS